MGRLQLPDVSLDSESMRPRIQDKLSPSRATETHPFEHLREVTREAHEAIEDHPRLAALLSPTLSRQEYAATLACLHAYFATLEPPLTRRLAERKSLFPHYRWHSRALALHRDLMRLGIPCGFATPPSVLPPLKT